jgi:hypothetical protein
VSWIGYLASGYLRRPPENIGPLTRVR